MRSFFDRNTCCCLMASRSSMLNRALRIYPAYLVVLALTFAMMFIDGRTTIAYWLKPDHWDQSIGDFFSKLDGFSWSGQAAVWLSNLFIFGTNFLTMTWFTPAGTLVSGPAPGATLADAFLFFPPAWTLAVELTFYVLAPLVLWRRPLLIVPVCIVVILIFPAVAELIAGPLGKSIVCCFLGILSYFAYERLPTAPWVKATGFGVTIAIVLLYLLSNAIPYDTEFKIYGVLFLTWIGLPFIFASSKSLVVDRLLGDLSYALYLVHFLAFKVLLVLIAAQNIWVWYYPTLIALAVAITHGVEVPIDRFRQRLVLSREKLSLSAANEAAKVVAN